MPTEHGPPRTCPGDELMHDQVRFCGIHGCPGEFAEAVRDQFMSERQEHFAEVEQRIMDETLQQPECSRDHVAAALRKMDPDLPEAQVCVQSKVF